MLAIIDGDVLLHATLWETTGLQKALDKLKLNIEDYKDGAFANDCVIAVGPYDGKNYRDDMYPQYKQTAARVQGRGERPEHFNKVKDYLYGLDNVVVGNNIEADDLLGILSRQLGDEGIMVTVDKDMDQLSGRHYNPRQNRYYIVTEEEANRFFLRQLITGDPMDKIPGLPRYGPKKAEELLSNYADNTELATAVVEEYRKVYEDEWENYFTINGKLLYLQRSDYDWFSLDKFNKRFRPNAAANGIQNGQGIGEAVLN